MGKKERQFEQSSEWLDWLSDNAATKSALKPKNATESSYKTYRAQHNPQASDDRPSEDDAVVINFHLPEIHLPVVPWRRVLKVSVGLVLIGVAIFATPYIIEQTKSKSINSSDTSSATQQPAYAPLAPTSSSTTGSKVRNEQYDSTRQLYKYNDTYEGIALTVSQQPLPDDIRNNPDKLKALATSIGANESVTTTNGTVYVSTSSESKLTTQRLVFASKQLLVFIQADGVLKNAEWVKYVQSLQSKV